MLQPWAWIASTANFLGNVYPFKLLRIFNRNRSQLAAPCIPLQTSFIPTHARPVLAAVELGGTTCVAALSYFASPTEIFDRIEVPTTTPLETIPILTHWLDERMPFAALGVASFGPIDLDPSSQNYGYITSTPKPNWRNFYVLKPFLQYKVPLAFDTDVNAPALAEFVHGSHGTKLANCAYITVGTGIGVGLVINGAPVHGLMHPEGGHIMPMRHPDDNYKGFTSLHPGSVESMAAARACAERCSVDPKDLPEVPDSHPAWDIVAYYLAQLCVSVMFLVSPNVIVLSGGIMQRHSLFSRIRAHFAALNDGYVNVPRVRDDLESYIVPSRFGDDCGIIGALELARRAFSQT